MTRFALLLVLLAILGLGCFWLLWPATEPGPDGLGPQAEEAPAAFVVEAADSAMRKPVGPGFTQLAVSSSDSSAQASVDIEVLSRDFEALQGQLHGTVFYSADSDSPMTLFRTYAPLPFAEIEVGFWHAEDAPRLSFEIQADAAGRYSLDLSRLRELCTTDARLGEKIVRLLVTAPHSSFPGHWELLEDLLPSPNQVEASPRLINLYLQQQPTRIVRGRVVDPHGQPIPGARVETALWFTSEERCDWRGRFFLDSQIPSDWTAEDSPEPLQLRLSDDCGRWSELQIPWAELPDDNDLGDLVLDPDLLITGTALATDGTPLPHWTVRIHTEPGRTSANARCDAEGRFTYSATHTSTHRLYLHGFGNVPIVATAAPRHDLEVRASNPTALLRVLDPDGQPIPSEGGWGFLLCEPDDQGSWRPVRPSRGIIEDPWLDTTQLTFPEPGVYRVNCESSGLRGTWSLNEQIEVRGGHQQFELPATYAAR
jgi:protocatechuate 3,4-dioxygenase beta subunit